MLLILLTILLLWINVNINSSNNRQTLDPSCPLIHPHPHPRLVLPIIIIIKREREKKKKEKKRESLVGETLHTQIHKAVFFFSSLFLSQFSLNSKYYLDICYKKACKLKLYSSSFLFYYCDDYYGIKMISRHTTTTIIGLLQINLLLLPPITHH